MDYKDIRTLNPASTDKSKLSGKAVLVHDVETGAPMAFDATKIGGDEASFANLTGEVNDNAKLKTAFDAKADKTTTYTKSEVDTAISNHHDSTKQNVIDDLTSIRTGASKGNTAYQKPSGGIPVSDINLSQGQKDALNSGITASKVTEIMYYERNDDGTITPTEDMDEHNTEVFARLMAGNCRCHVHVHYSDWDTVLEYIPVVRDNDLGTYYFSCVDNDSIHYLQMDGPTNIIETVVPIQEKITDLSTIRSGAALGATALQSVPATYRTAAAQDVIDAGKQNTLTSAQLNAVNSGITADKVAKIESLVFDISTTTIADVANAINAKKPIVTLVNGKLLYATDAKIYTDKAEVCFADVSEGTPKFASFVKWVDEEGDWALYEDAPLQKQLTEEDGSWGEDITTLKAHDIVSEDCSLEDDQKETARANIGATKAVAIVKDLTSTTKTLTASANTHYIFGTLTALNLTFGQGEDDAEIDVIFKVGTSANVVVTNGRQAEMPTPTENAVMEINAKWYNGEWVVLFSQVEQATE